MAKSIGKIVSGAGTIIHSILVPLFVLVFVIYYKPNGLYEFLNMSNTSFTFNATMLFCVVLVTLSITRGWLYLLGKYRTLSGRQYLMWCIAETLILSLFCSLYIVLISPDKLSFFEITGKAFISLLAMTIYPYGFICLGFEIYARDYEDSNPVDENSLIRFYDENKKLRFVIAPEAVIFIKSEDNYVMIHYLDRNRVKKFALRSSMRALEEDLLRHGLVRCHRSYFINPPFIKMVRRDEAGLIVADMKQEGIESIPISRKYQEEISKIL